MSVNVPNPGTYFQTVGTHLVALREAMNDLTQDGKYLNAMGGATFLEGAPFNLSAADATAFANTIGAVTPSNATVTAVYNFLDSAISLTGGN